MTRVRQFFTDLAAPLLPLDEPMFSQYLTKAENQLFRGLRRAEMRHSIRVARLTLENLNADLPQAERNAVVRAALLHDAGKIRYALGPVGKTIMVLFKGILAKPGSRLARTRAGDVYLNHPEYSWQLLQELDSFPDHPYLYDLVRWHHEPERFLERYKGSERTVFLAFRQADDAS